MRIRVVTCGVVLASLLFVLDVRPDEKVTVALEPDAIAENPIENVPTRPFASKHQQRRIVEPRLVVGNRYTPQGGSCLPHMYCACVQWDASGWCVGTYRCEATPFANRNCRYVCMDPYFCDTITDEECQQSNPCSD